MKNVNAFIGSVSAMYSVLPVIRKTDIVDTGKTRLQVVTKAAGEKQNMIEFADLNRHGARLIVHPSKFAETLVGRTIHITSTDQPIPVDPDVAIKAEMALNGKLGDKLMAQIEALTSQMDGMSKRTKAYKALAEQQAELWDRYQCCAEADMQYRSELATIVIK